MKLFVVALLVLMAYVSSLPQKKFLLDDIYLLPGDCEHSDACSHCGNSHIHRIRHGGLIIEICCRTCGKPNATVHIGFPHSALECQCL